MHNISTTSILPVFVSKHKNVIDTFNNNEQIDLNANVLQDHDYISAIPVLSTFVEDITNYIAGFVVKQIKKRISCATCEKQLETNDSTNLLLLKKNRGMLIKPSEDVNYICIWTEKVIREYQNKIFNKIFKKEKKPVIIDKVVQHVLPYVFFNLNHHILSQELFNNHKKQLIVCITEHYINIRFHHLGNTYNKEQKTRQKLTKLILFNHE